MIKSKYRFFILTLLFLLAASCNKEQKIERLLNSEDKQDLIEGAFEAGETGNKKFIPLLLKNANDPRITHNLRFKGMSVYQSKMNALKKILKQQPTVAITYKPDSTVIKFYTKATNLDLQSGR